MLQSLPQTAGIHKAAPASAKTNDRVKFGLDEFSARTQTEESALRCCGVGLDTIYLCYLLESFLNLLTK